MAAPSQPASSSSSASSSGFSFSFSTSSSFSGFGSFPAFGSGFGSVAQPFASPAPANAAAPGEEEEDENPEAYEAKGQWAPKVSLPEVAEVTGEEDEEVLFKQRSKLYRFAKDTGEWKERGIGDVKLLKHKQNKRVRVLLRQEKTLKLILNHYVNPEMKLTPSPTNDRSHVWAAEDFSEGEVKVETFCLRFKTVELYEEFKKVYDESRKINRDTFAAPASAEAGASSSVSAASPSKPAAPSAQKPATPAVPAPSPAAEKPTGAEDALAKLKV